MASSYTTQCPKCGGRAHWNTDDGITWCDEPNCKELSVERPDYRPPARRGGIAPSDRAKESSEGSKT